MDSYVKLFSGQDTREAGCTWLGMRTSIPMKCGLCYGGANDQESGKSVFVPGGRSQTSAQAVMHCSDRGSQYCSYEYRHCLEQFAVKTSMSGKGSCFDNAPMESFWGMLKQELIYHCHFRIRQEAIRDITEYIEIFYNRQRLQAKLGFLSPAIYA